MGGETVLIPIVQNRNSIVAIVAQCALFNGIDHMLRAVILVAPFPPHPLLFCICLEKSAYHAKAPIALTLSMLFRVKVHAYAKVGHLRTQQRALQELRGPKVRSAVSPQQKLQEMRPPSVRPQWLSVFELSFFAPALFCASLIPVTTLRRTKGTFSFRPNPPLIYSSNFPEGANCYAIYCELIRSSATR